MSTRLIRRGGAAAAAALLNLLPMAAAPIHVVTAASPCDGWTMSTLFSGLGILEYVIPEPRGTLLVSSSSRNTVERMSRAGATTTLASLNAPGAIVLRGGGAFVTTGDSATSGALNTADGTVDTLDLATGAVAVYSSGLTMPNGMTFSAAGDGYVTRDVPLDTTVTRIRVADPANPDTAWARVPTTNGARVDPTQTWLYTSSTFEAAADIRRVRLTDPTQVEVVVSLSGVGSPVPKGLDDMTMDAAGILYVTANGSGEVLRVDPVARTACVIASGLQNPSSVEFGAGGGFAADHLVVGGFDGTIRELTPPPQSAPGGSSGSVASGSPPAGGANGSPTTAAARVPVAAAAAAALAGALVLGLRRRRARPGRSEVRRPPAPPAGPGTTGT